MTKKRTSAVSRRTFLAGSTALATGAIGAPALVGAQPAAVKVGMIHPVTGFVAYNGQQSRLGGTILELSYKGLNHSDTTLVMRLPQERVLFVVDSIPVGTVPGRGMIDFHPLEAEKFIADVIAMDWATLIPGHPGPGDRLGTKKDAEDQLQLLKDASAEMKVLAREGKCWDQAEKEFKLDKYASWPGYAAGLPFIARRYCGLWGRGT